MVLTRHLTASGPRWALDGYYIPPPLDLSCLLALPKDNMPRLLKTLPHGVFVMTGTGIVPPDSFTLAPGDVLRISVAQLVIENKVDCWTGR